MSIPAPFVSSVMSIDPAWIDYNGHMNMAYHTVLFDRCADEAYGLLGFGPEYAEKRRLTTYTAEFHICYLRELHLDSKVRCTFQLLDYDEKRLHLFQELRHVDGWVAATGETLALHIDMNGPKVTPFPPDIVEKLRAMREAHAVLPWPARAGRSIGIPRKTA